MLEGSVMRRVAHGTQIHIHDSLHVVLQEHVILCYVPTANLRKFSSILSLSHVQLFATPWTTSHQASPSFTISSNSCPLSQWRHPTISSSVIPFSLGLRSFPASESFLMNWIFASGGQSIEASASASVSPVNIQGWFPLGLIGLISLQSEGLSRVFSNTTV